MSTHTNKLAKASNKRTRVVRVRSQVPQTLRHITDTRDETGTAAAWASSDAILAAAAVGVASDEAAGKWRGDDGGEARG